MQYIKGIPLWSLITFSKCLQHFTSYTIVAWGCFFNTSTANNIKILSGKITSVLLVTTPNLSASPSKARPKSALCSNTACCKSFKLANFAGSGWWLGKLPSGSLNKSITSQPNSRSKWGATIPATPLPESITTLRFFKFCFVASFINIFCKISCL